MKKGGFSNNVSQNNPSQIHTEVLTGTLGQTLKKIEKSFDNEQHRVVHGTKTSSNQNIIDSNPDQTLNESLNSLKRNNEKLNQQNPLDAGFSARKYDETSIIEVKDDNTFDRKSAENRSEDGKQGEVTKQ